MAKEPGFTLIEMLMVVLILGILSMLGLPMLGSALEETRLSKAANEVVSALEYAQLKALNAGRQTRVTFDSAADTLLVEHFTPNADLLGAESELDELDVEGGAFAPMGHPLERGTDYLISFAGRNLFSGVDIVAVDLGGSNLIIFDALGTPSSGGTITLAYGNSQWDISVDGLTGKVKVGG